MKGTAAGRHYVGSSRPQEAWVWSRSVENRLAIGGTTKKGVPPWKCAEKMEGRGKVEGGGRGNYMCNAQAARYKISKATH
jgi:hypothetical protein